MPHRIPLKASGQKIVCVNMNPAHTDPPQLAQDKNPFAAPKRIAGFPIFTFLGIRCYRDIKRYLVDLSPFA